MATNQPLQEGYCKTEDGRWEIIGNYEIQGVTPEMIDWWWDNIDTTERYKLWHPTDHISFERSISPRNGHVGAVQRIAQFLAAPLLLPSKYVGKIPPDAAAEYRHVLLASSTMEGVRAADLMHEYEEAAFGTRLRTHFHFPPGPPEELSKLSINIIRRKCRTSRRFCQICIDFRPGGDSPYGPIRLRQLPRYSYAEMLVHTAHVFR